MELYTSGATWNQILLGRLTNYTTSRFWGKVSGLRISNVGLYTGNFTPPEAFVQTSNTTFLLWNNFTEKLGGVTFTTIGTVTYNNENASTLPYLIWKRDRPTGVEQSLSSTVENPLLWNKIVESKGQPLIDLSTTITTTFPNAVSSPNYAVFRVPVAGLYEFKLSCNIGAGAGYVDVSLMKNRHFLTTAYDKEGTWTGGVFTCETFMNTAD